MGGDFIAVKLEEEIRGCSRLVNVREIEEFNGFIENFDGIDVAVVGRNFLWFSLDGAARSRLDHFLFTGGLLGLWKVDNQVIGNINLLNHYYIWFEGNVQN